MTRVLASGDPRQLSRFKFSTRLDALLILNILVLHALFYLTDDQTEDQIRHRSCRDSSAIFRKWSYTIPRVVGPMRHEKCQIRLFMGSTTSIIVLVHDVPFMSAITACSFTKRFWHSPAGTAIPTALEEGYEKGRINHLRRDDTN